MASFFRFGRPVEVVDWVSQCSIGVIPFDQGLTLMLRSQRFDCGHATIDVRTLHPDDAERMKIPATMPVIFQQD